MRGKYLEKYKIQYIVSVWVGGFVIIRVGEFLFSIYFVFLSFSVELSCGLE